MLKDVSKETDRFKYFENMNFVCNEINDYIKITINLNQQDLSLYNIETDKVYDIILSYLVGFKNAGEFYMNF